ncbi:MAG: hypothetical protein DME59_20370 [Verrucomicrobia bacterium]|nr:MAG: hypothetical protein DME59_20370 [Verrucomicrobiota bacterium]
MVDFAICAEGDRLVPRLIELQAFPSLFGFQLLLLDCIRKAYTVIPRNWTSSFGGIKDDAYLEVLRRAIIADSPIGAGKTKNARGFCRYRNVPRHSTGLRDQNQEARPAIIL